MSAIATPPKLPTRESRVLRLTATELRASKEADGSFKVEGYAAKFGVLSHDFGGWREKIAPGAFSRAIREKQDVTFLWMHDRRTLMARVKSGTLSLEADATGLRVKASIADTQDGKDLFARMSRGDVDQMSFTFRTVRDDWEFNGPIAVRTLQDVDLYDVSAVDEGQYPETELGMRAFAEARAKNDALRSTPTSVLRERLRFAEAEALGASH